MLNKTIGIVPYNLDWNSLSKVHVMFYTVKYTSSLHENFRETSMTKFLEDLRNYQMNHRKKREDQKKTIINKKREDTGFLIFVIFLKKYIKYHLIFAYPHWISRSCEMVTTFLKK